ncbi:hypothetical protein ON010_g2520 [Phytophthora cinnamomi]|nr:hypothetical protein ON010_g2520 [Phytophthora cinnamomi]
MDLVLDGRLRVFRTLPSGLSSMIPTARGWSVGDYAAEFSSNAETLYVDLFAFANGNETPDDDTGVAVRRNSLAISLKQDFNAPGVAGTSRSSNDVLSVYGTVSSATYTPSRRSNSERGNESNLSEMQTSHRAHIWNELEWRPVLRVQAQYVSVARRDG